MRRLVLAAGLLFSGPALADQFLGVERDGGAPPPAQAPTATKKAKKPPVESEASTSDDGGDLSDDLSFGAALGAGSGFITGQATLGYALNRYCGVDTTYSYFRFDNGSTTGEQYGPEIDLVLRYPNKTIVTPFVGAGPGYTKWIREHDGEAFDEGSSGTGTAFGGLGIRLTKHFGIRVVRQQVTYWGAVPKRFDDRARQEPRTVVATNIGFNVMF